MKAAEKKISYLVALKLALGDQKIDVVIAQDQSCLIAQLIFRFSKLQDSLGEKIFPAILILYGEEINNQCAD